MQAFKNKSTGSPSDEEISAEYLGLSPKEKEIVITPDVAGQNQYWGGLIDIDKVSVFLNKSQLEYKQLEELLRLEFINPEMDSKIVHSDTTCDTETKKISGLTNEKLDRINRFLRLNRKIGWQLWELDRVLMNNKIGSGVISNTFLVQLKNFDEVKKQLNLKVEELLAYYEDLNIAENKSLYNKIFRNKVVLDPLPQAFKVEHVTENPFPNPAPPLPDSSLRTITGQLKSLSAALKLKEEEAIEIQSKSLGGNENLSLSNISLFYRIASLSRKQKLSAKEYYILMDILNTGAVFDVFGNPSKTKDFRSR